MFLYDAKVGDAAPLGKSVAPPSEVGADAAALDELRGFLQGRKGRRRRREGRRDDFTRNLNRCRRTMNGRRRRRRIGFYVFLSHIDKRKITTPVKFHE